MKMRRLVNVKKIGFSSSSIQNCEDFVRFSLILNNCTRRKIFNYQRYQQAACTCIPVIHLDVLQS